MNNLTHVQGRNTKVNLCQEYQKKIIQDPKQNPDPGPTESRIRIRKNHSGSTTLNLAFAGNSNTGDIQYIKAGSGSASLPGQNHLIKTATAKEKTIFPIQTLVRLWTVVP